MSKFAVYSRKRVTVNTDPLRRCYHGVHFSTRTEWSGWCYLGTYPDKAAAEHAAAEWRAINPTRQYEVRPDD